MRPLPSPTGPYRLLAEDGFTLVELLAAVLILTVGLLGLIGAFDSARKLNLLSERRTSMAHRAQLEIERLQAEPYEKLAMTSAPTHSSTITNPDFYVKEGTTKYQYGEKAAEEEQLVVSSGGAISPSPKERKCSNVVGACEWSDGEVSGNVYDFVTWYSEPSKLCTKYEKPCPKRITVVVTANVPSGNHEPHAVRVSTLVAEQ